MASTVLRFVAPPGITTVYLDDVTGEATGTAAASYTITRLAAALCEITVTEALTGNWQVLLDASGDRGAALVLDIADTADTFKEVGLSEIGSDGKVLIASSAVTELVAAIWNALTSGMVTVGSIGKRIVDYLTGDAFARLGPPAGASVSADIAAGKADLDTLKNRLTAARAAFLEKLNITGNVASQDAVDNITNSVRNSVYVPAEYKIPASGDPATRFKITVLIYGLDGGMEDPDSSAVTVDVADQAGVDRGSRLYDAATGGFQVQNMNQVAAGHYELWYESTNGDAEEDLTYLVNYAEQTKAMVGGGKTQMRNELSGGFTSSYQTYLTTLFNDWADGGRLDIVLDGIPANVWGEADRVITGVTGPAGTSIAGAVWAKIIDGGVLSANDALMELHENIDGWANSGLPAMSAEMKAEILVEVNTALDAAIPELGVGQPSATPSVRAALMLLHMALRNKTGVPTSGTDALEIYNDAGTVIAKKVLTDSGGDYAEAKMVSG